MSTKMVTAMIFGFKGIYNENGIYKWPPLFYFQGHEVPLSSSPFSLPLFNLTKYLSILVNTFGN